MKVLQHILTIALMSATAPVEGQSIDSTLNSWRSDGGMLGLGNRRSVAPGEFLLMAPEGTLESLMAMELDRFQLVVDHPKYPDRMRSIHYLRSNTGLEALYTEGDLRYITYDMTTLENSSQSAVVGYDFWAQPYFFEDQLHFQNGHSNWHIHANRYYHSRTNGEIERSSVDPWPEGAEHSIPLVGDSSSILIPMHGQQDNWTETGIIYALDHLGFTWNAIGQLKEGFQRLEGWKRVYHLKDYWLIHRESDINVIRKSDLHVATMKSSTFNHIKLLTDSGPLHGSAYVIQGNKIGICNAGVACAWDDIGSLSLGVEWSPMVVPLEEEALSEVGNDSKLGAGNRPWIPIIIGLQALIIIGLLAKARSKKPMAVPHPLEAHEGKSSELLVMLLEHTGRMLNTAELDALFGLDGLESPETRRSRRSRMVHVANLEANALFGKSIIERSKSPSDRRIMVYHIQDVAATTAS